MFGRLGRHLSTSFAFKKRQFMPEKFGLTPGFDMTKHTTMKG